MVSIFSYKSLTRDARNKLRQMLQNRKYNKLSSRKLSEKLHIGRRSFDSLKETKNLVKKRGNVGRPKKISIEQEQDIINKASEIRRNHGFVTMKWATKYANDNGINVKRDTVTRMFKRHSWRRVSTKRKQSFCLTKRYFKIINNWKYYTRNVIAALQSGATLHVMDETGIVSNMFPSHSYAPMSEHDIGIKAIDDTTKDTLALTISSDGNADIFYIPFLKKN